MLASTVQFSNNDQPPITLPTSASSLGPALKAGHAAAPSDTQQRARPGPLSELTFHAEAVLVIHQDNRAE